MTVEQLRLLRDANPFFPFVIHLPDGRELPVPHRDFLSISPAGRIVHVYRADGSWSLVDLLRVGEVEVRPPAAPVGANGPADPAA